MEREKGIQHMREKVEKKFKKVQTQETKLSIESRRKLKQLNMLLLKNKRLKLETLEQALAVIRKLASEISTANDLEEKRASSSSDKIAMRRQSTHLRVFFTRIREDNLPISKRTRSKSIDAGAEYAVSYPSDRETDEENGNDRSGLMPGQAVKRKKSKSVVQQQQTNFNAELKKRKSVERKAPTTEKKAHVTEDIGKYSSSVNVPGKLKRKSVAMGSTDKKAGKLHPQKGIQAPVNQKKQYKRNVLYDSDTEEHVAEATRQPCSRAVSAKITKVYPDIPNDNCDIHCKSNFIMKCCLCPYRGVNMVEHYVRKHPQQEVFVSRISPHQSNMIRNCPIPKHSSQTVVPATEAILRFCHFCEKEHHLTVTQWIKHVAEHTGEYEYYGREKKTYKEICFRNNHILAYLCDRCNYVQTRLSSMEHHLEKQHPSIGNDALKNMEYVRFSVVEKRFISSMSSNGNSIVASNAIIGMGKVIKNQPMKADTSEDGYNSSCSSDTMSMIASDDEATIISLKPSKSPPLQLSGLENDKVPVCLESIHERREHSNDSSSIGSNMPCVATVASMPSVSCDLSVARVPIIPVVPIIPIVPKVPSGKKKIIKESIMQVEVNEEESEWRATKKCGKQQQTTATAQNQSLGKPYAYSRPISVVISDRAMNYESNIYGTSNETVIPSINVQVNSDINGNRSAYWWPKPWIQNSSPKMAIHYNSMLEKESLVAFYKCMGHACDFTTQNDKTMKQHLLHHDFSKGFKREVMQWLECCYCAFFGNGPKELVDHLQSVHGDCGYQCNRCFYRSREASALAVHQSLFHSDSKELSNRIFQCIKRVKNYNSSDQGLIIRNMVKTVPLLVCNACPSRKFFGLRSFQDHIESHPFDFIKCNLCSKICGKRELMNHMQHIHAIHLFQCVYCQFGTFNNSWIEHHVSVHHPESIFCYHVRNASQTLEPYVRPKKVIPPNRFEVFSSA